MAINVARWCSALLGLTSVCSACRHVSLTVAYNSQMQKLPACVGIVGSIGAVITFLVLNIAMVLIAVTNLNWYQAIIYLHVALCAFVLGGMLCYFMASLSRISSQAMQFLDPAHRANARKACATCG